MIEEVNNSFTIYPNPATSNINLYSNANFYKADIQMFDAIGRIVYAQVNKNISKGSIININLSHLPKGVYSIRIQSDNNETIVKKLIQQ